MVISKLEKAGISGDLLYGAGFLSIAASIYVWYKAKASGDTAHAERFGIFIGLWAPTFMALGNALSDSELRNTLSKRS